MMHGQQNVKFLSIPCYICSRSSTDVTRQTGRSTRLLERCYLISWLYTEKRSTDRD